MSKKDWIKQDVEEQLKYAQEKLESIELDEQIAKARLAIAKAEVSQLQSRKRTIKKDIKDCNEVLESLS